MHGPYWQWTAIIDGKTVTRRLTEPRAQRYREWVANDRKLIPQLRRAANDAIDLTMQADQSDSAEALSPPLSGQIAS
ncbi:MAG: DUF6788 family protein [Candidatus Dormibacteria bacterium]